MRTFKVIVAALGVVVASCEQGPDQLFRPNTGDPSRQNGFVAAPPWSQEGTASYDDHAGGSDAAGRARFCTEVEKTALVQRMVSAPVIPDVSVGGVPMRTADGRPLHADSLIGRPEDGKFCEPDGVYSNAFTWGPTEEVIILFNQETRLVEAAVAYLDYLGTLEGDFTENNEKVHVVVKPRERLKIGSRELDQYTSRADQATKPNAWLNFKNVNRFHRMVRETFFNAPPFADDYDCIAEQICDIIYTTASESTPQDTFIVLQDSGVQIRFTPDGHAKFLYLEPVRGAPFERRATVAFAPNSSDTEMRFQFASQSKAGCTLTLEEELTFGAFKSRCIDASDTRTLTRGTLYDVYSARDAVQAQFNGVNLHFLRRTSTSTVFKNGEAPKDSDKLFGISFSRSLDAPVQEFRPKTLALAYKDRLEQRLFEAVTPSARATHPVALYRVVVPFAVDDPQRIGELVDPRTKKSWLPAVVAEIVALYYALSPTDQALVDARIGDELFLIEPFVDAVIDTFSHGDSRRPGAIKFFQTTDDRRWSIAETHFRRAGVPYRLEAQYSLNFGAVTFVDVSRGQSEIDTLFDGLHTSTTSAYFTLSEARAEGPLGLGGSGITVNGFDRQLQTLNVLLPGPAGALPLVVPGEPIQDLAGYTRQIRGERREFVPANRVRLLGKETQMDYYVEANGEIGRIDQFMFKGTIELCPGLAIRFGDNVQRIIEAWVERSPVDAFKNCEIVYNYSANGNVLDGVASIANRVSVTVFDKRAVTASIWR